MRSVIQRNTVRRSLMAATGLVAAGLICTPRASLAQATGPQIFVDNFNNGVIEDSDTRPGFWNAANNSGAPLYTETAGINRLTLRSQRVSGGDNFPYTEIASPLLNEFNFFRSPITLSASGLGYASGDSIDALTQFTLTSQALGGSAPTEYQAQDAISLWVTNRTSTNNGSGVGTLVFGLKQDAPNRSTAFEGYPLIGPGGNVVRPALSFPGQIRSFRLVLAPTFFDLLVTRDTSTSNPTPVTERYSAGLDIYRINAPFGANWNTPTNPQGDSAINIQTQLNNVSSTTPVANFSIAQFAVNKFESAWTGPSGGNWSSSGNWSNPDVTHVNADNTGLRSSVPNFLGANVRFPQTSGPTSVTADLDQTVGALIFDSTQPYTLNGNFGANGQGTIRLATRYIQSELRVVRGAHTINAPIIFSVGSDALLTADDAASVLTVPAASLEDPSSQNLTKAGPGRVEFAALQANAVAVSGGTLRVLANAGGASALAQSLSVVNSVSAAGGLLDLTNNDLIVRGSNLATVRGLLASWFNGGSRNGSGIGSSLATAASGTGLAVLDNSLAGSAYYSSFDGASLSASDVLVKYTYLGDTNIDGVVNGADLANVIEGLSNATATSWREGDFNYDGRVTLADLALFYTGQAAQASRGPIAGSTLSAATGPVGAVPEPTSAGMLLAGAALIARRRR